MASIHESVGAVVSTLTPVTESTDVRPARSVHEPVALWSAPSPRVVEPLVSSTPDRASTQVHVTITGVSFRPCALPALGAREMAMVGSVRSTSILTVHPSRPGRKRVSGAAHSLKCVPIGSWKSP